MKNKIYFFIILMTVSGCGTLAPWTQLQQSEYVDNARSFKATIPVGWMRSNQNPHFLITRDGVLLNCIEVARYKVDEQLKNTKKKFLSDMSSSELADVHLDIVRTTPDTSNVEVLENSPKQIDQHQGYFLKYNYMDKEGLKYEVHAAGFLKDKWVYIIFYSAPKQHYFDLYIKDFDRFLESFQLTLK